MRHIARFAIGRPRSVLAVWLALLIAALLLADTARESLHETDLQIPGTPAALTASVVESEFGGQTGMAILLKGPKDVLDREGPRLVRRLQRIDAVQVLSPWDVTGERTLRTSSSDQALLAVRVSKPFKQISDETTPAIQREIARTVKPPLKSELTGMAPVMRALNEASADSIRKGERIALPILFVLLLLVFRSPIAALVPALSGFLVIRVGAVVFGGLNNVVEMDALSLSILTMIGLALGVDYSLLIVSRFREELARGLGVAAAVEEAIARAGRTVLFAGTALAVGMLGALAISPGALLVSGSLGVIIATVTAVLVAMTAIPAGLVLIGENVNRWQFAPSGGNNPWIRLAMRALSKPVVAVFFTLLPLAVLAAPVIAMNTGPPSVKNLPPDNEARKQFVAFEKDVGSGWSAMFEITVKTKGPITSAKHLKQLDNFQKRLAREPDVEAVMGPAPLRRRSRLLRDVVAQLDSGDAQSAALAKGLKRLVKGTGALREGIDAGATGAGALAGGLGTAATGTGELASGLGTAAPQTRTLADATKAADKGVKVASGAISKSAEGARGLEEPIKEIDNTLKDQTKNADKKLVDPLDNAQTAVQAALRALADVPPAVAADPTVQKAKAEVQEAAAQLTPLKTNLTTLISDLDTSSTASTEVVKGMGKLSDGLDELADGTKELQKGTSKISSGTDQLATGIGQLATGSQALDSGIQALLGGSDGKGGAKALAAGLHEAVPGVDQLGQGLSTMLDGIVEVRSASSKQAKQLRRSGIDLNQTAISGYFVLSAVEGMRPQTRTNLSFVINTPRGGDTARVMVVPRTGAFTEATAKLRKRLENDTEKFGKRIDAETQLGGPAVLLDDYDRATSARFPYLVLILVLVTFLVLLVVFRSPVLAFSAVILNLVTIGAAIGVMVLVFQGDSPLFGGPGHLDAISLSIVFAVTFGLSIDYEVFLISRLIEGRAVTGSTNDAIVYSLEKTAVIITGAAAIMAGVFIAFALSPVGATRQIGVGLTVAVILDATVVRLILLPAMIKLFGERTWAVPRWLDRILPKFSTH